MDQERTILLIDDDLVLHQLVGTLLKDTNYQLISAHGGGAGLRMILEKKPDLILLDFMMPDITGMEVYRELVENPKYQSCQSIPVVILSAKENDIHTRAKLLEKGIQAYLTKPFGLRELKNIIENIFITNEIRLKNLQLRREIFETKEHLELLIDNAPIGILSTNLKGEIIKINPFLIKLMGISEPAQLLGYNLVEQNLFGKYDLRKTFRSILNEGLQVTLNAFEYTAPNNEWLKLNVKAVPLQNSENKISGLTLIVKDITALEKKAYELSILRQIGVAMQRTLKLDELLHLILTTITAGCALGFSRAVLFMISEHGQSLVGKMGVGPGSPEEAGRIWDSLSQEHLNLQSFLEKYGKQTPSQEDAFNRRIQTVQLELKDTNCPIAQSVRMKTPIKVDSTLRRQHSCHSCHHCTEAEEFIVVPLIVKNKVSGVVVADNMYNTKPVDDDMMELLVLFASQAAVAIERAEAYQRLEEKKDKLEQAYGKLQQAQDQLLRKERLATIGRMAAQVAHEIRNPLVTIGGFARTLIKSEKVASDDELTLMTQIIAEEVSRLEKILNNVLDFVKLSKPEFKKEDINRIVQESLLIIQDEMANKDISIHKTLDLNLAPLWLDPQQFKQVLINVLQNAIYSMQDGDLSIRTYQQNESQVVVEIEDTGVGIPEEILENVFTAFFTTKPNGTGLGLPITQQIIHGHGGKIDVKSEVGKGTLFRFIMPQSDKSNQEQFN